MECVRPSRRGSSVLFCNGNLSELARAPAHLLSLEICSDFVDPCERTKGGAKEEGDLKKKTRIKGGHNNLGREGNCLALGVLSKQISHLSLPKALWRSVAT